MDFAADLNIFYSDFAKSVTLLTDRAQPVTANAILDKPGQTVLGGEILVTDYALRYPVGNFPDIQRGDRLQIAGEAHDYRARQCAQPDGVDGLEMVVPLEVIR